MNLINAIALTKSKATITRKLPPAISNRARSPLRIFALGAANRTCSIEFHLAALTKVLQRRRGTFASGCFSAKEASTLQAIILMRQYVPKTGTLQDKNTRRGKPRRQ